MCDLCALRCKTCWKRIVLVILTCLAEVSESRRLLKHPECRPNTNCRRSNPSVTDNTFIYYVNKTRSVKEQQVLLKYDGKEMSFLICCNCNQDDTSMAADDPALPAMTTLTFIKEVEFKGCIVPNITYASVLAALNITYLHSSYYKDGVLRLTELPAEPRLQGYHMEGLSIKGLLITAANCDLPTRPKSDFLDHLPGLKNLELKKCVEPEKEATTHLPESLVTLSLWNTQLAVDDASHNGSFWLKRLASLRSLTLEEAEDVPEGLVFTPPPLSLLQNLTKLVLSQVPLSKLSDNTTWLKGSKLQSLTLQHCKIEELPNGLFEGADIAKIILDNNNLKTLNEAFAPLQSSLKYLDLSDNMLNDNALVNALVPLKKLETLIVSNNPLKSLCDSAGDIQTNMPSGLPKSLRHLDLRNTGATRICYDWIENDSLMYLDLDDNEIENLLYSDLKMRRAKNETVTLSLKGNRSLRIKNLNQKHRKNCINESSPKHVVGDEYRRVQVKLQLDLSVCDCNAYWLRDMLHNCPLLKSDDVTCRTTIGETSLFDVITRNFTCTYHGVCPKGCSCVKRPTDNATVVQCLGILPLESDWPPAGQGYPLALHVAPGMLTRVPRIKLVELHAPFNNISKLEERDIPDTLRVLDVRNNRIKVITSGVAQQLYLLTTTQGCNVSLSGNPLACGCEDESAIATLQHAEIWDWNTTKCADHQYIIGKTKLCPDIMLQTLLTVTGALLIVTLIAIVFLHLRPRIRQFFFDHNCGLQCFFSFEDDVDDPLKTHDVFISYSFHDHQYAKTLIKRLEDHGYSTIEHCRDWLPGRTISQQITDSVLSARRTLLLVSDNFANSQWGLEEFHAAHAHAMERGSACVIVIRCNLLAPEKLPDDLRLYLNRNTYLDWSDRYFWKKLLQVMPTPQVSQQVPAISLLQGNMVQPSAGIKFASPLTAAPGIALSRVSLDKELPLSELVLVPPSQQLEPDFQQSSGKASPVTPVVREPPQTGENKSSLPSNTQREPIMALRMPAVA